MSQGEYWTKDSSHLTASVWMHPEWNDRIQRSIRLVLSSLYVGMYVRLYSEVTTSIDRLNLHLIHSTKDVASEWGYGLSLNAGITEGKSAISRLLTQFIPTTNALDPNLPSISEALAVLAGCTLVLSSQGSPFVHCKAFHRNLLPLQDYSPSRETCRGSKPLLLPFSPPKHVLLLRLKSRDRMLTQNFARLELHDTYPK